MQFLFQSDIMSESELGKACLHTTSGEMQPQALACGNDYKQPHKNNKES